LVGSSEAKKVPGLVSFFVICEIILIVFLNSPHQETPKNVFKKIERKIGLRERKGSLDSKQWVVSTRENMEACMADGFMALVSAVLTPDQARPSEVWEVSDGTQLVASSEVWVHRQ
jgi:hypothetical protein